MSEPKEYTLVIRDAPEWSSFKYQALLYEGSPPRPGSTPLSDTTTETKWGARWWASRKIKRLERDEMDPIRLTLRGRCR